MAGLTLWMGTVAQGSFAERLAAAAECGYSSMSVAPTDGEIVPPHHMRRLAEDAGIRLIALDPLVTWLPNWGPPAGRSLDPGRAALLEGAARFDVAHVLDMAQALGCASVSAIEPFGRPVSVERGAEAFAAVCDRAAQHGLAVQMEPMPFSGIPDIRTAASMVQLAGRPNGGLVLDTWHLFRSGGDPSLIAEIPMECLSVQLCDAPRAAEKDLWTEALDRRLLPGTGALDLAGVVTALGVRGFAGPIGPEVISAELRELPPTEAARQAAEACTSLLVSAGLTRWG